MQSCQERRKFGTHAVGGGLFETGGTPERGNELEKCCDGWAGWRKSPLTLAKKPRTMWSLTKWDERCVGSEEKEAEIDVGRLKT